MLDTDGWINMFSINNSNVLLSVSLKTMPSRNKWKSAEYATHYLQGYILQLNINKSIKPIYQLYMVMTDLYNMAINTRNR